MWFSAFKLAAKKEEGRGGIICKIWVSKIVPTFHILQIMIHHLPKVQFRTLLESRKSLSCSRTLEAEEK